MVSIGIYFHKTIFEKTILLLAFCHASIAYSILHENVVMTSVVRLKSD